MKVIAVTCSDIHLTLTAPISRSTEPDWLEAQGRVLDQVRAISEEHQAPIIYAGDIFHKYNAPPELINWAMRRLPFGYAVPGQHDLPLHNYDDIKKSAYWTLVESGKLIDLEWSVPVWEETFGEIYSRNCELMLHGFPWGKDIRFPNDVSFEQYRNPIHLAVVHKYIWKAGKTYVGAPEQEKLSAYESILKGFDAATFGDNHKAFDGVAGDCAVINTGCLIRRKADEINNRPTVGLVYMLENGSVQTMPHYLDTSEDLWSLDESMTADAELVKEDMGRFLKELRSLNSDEYNFKDAVTQFLATNKVSEGVKSILVEVLEDE